MTAKTPASATKPLAGWRVLVPRGGKWGDGVAATLRSFGGVPVIAPMINFASADDAPALELALTELQHGGFDWLVVTSATTVDVLMSQRVKIPASTKIAAVGETTGAALTLAGYQVDYVPDADNSARGLVKEWPRTEITGRVLIPQSDIADPTLVSALSDLGLDVQFVAAYRTVGVPVTESIRADVASGRIRAILVTSGSVARQIALQLGPLPEQTAVACIGPRTAFDARAAGLSVHIIAEFRAADSLVEALAEYAQSADVGGRSPLDTAQIDAAHIDAARGTAPFDAAAHSDTTHTDTTHSDTTHRAAPHSDTTHGAAPRSDTTHSDTATNDRAPEA
ncbi:uroporphyrinogen-III synthase [Glaciihabitans tibetensis]|uniref:Uroporphyrinogen-III synthase n=1 Tax=Glaciihabitans tibetensis TaxID=1266600 RepID=A0A2T0VCI4_9MICO|nr:uroporphyrinogen-III synthase [Glaciihabitans tibetensis]